MCSNINWCEMCLQIRNILKQGIETPEDQNDLRKMQLRELARLNGTLREDDNRWDSAEGGARSHPQGSTGNKARLLYPQDSSSLAEL